MKCDAVIEKIKARVAAIDPNGPRKVLDRINQGLEQVLIASHGHFALGNGILYRDLLRTDGDEVLILQVDHHIGRTGLTVRHLQGLQIDNYKKYGPHEVLDMFMEDLDELLTNLVHAISSLNVELEHTENLAWSVRALKVSDGKASSPDVVINLKDEDFIAIGTKQIPVKDAVAQGKVSMTGDQNLFQALVDAI
uniref:SCP2 domain-containing protein n=1 Tax=Anopheles culicifacies TaxID=139723 RepID=A0A182MBN6_9DIPT